MDTYKLTQEKLNTLLIFSAMESKLLMHFISDILEKNNIMSKDKFKNEFNDFLNLQLNSVLKESIAKISDFEKLINVSL